MGTLRLSELAADNIVAVNTLTLKPGQEQYVAPVSHSIAEAYVNPMTTWPRVIFDEDDVVGFIMGNFDPESPHEEFRCCVWRINVDAAAQGRGVGRFAVMAVAEEARSRGCEALTVTYEPGPGGPERFFERLGFVRVGESPYGEDIATLAL